MSALTRRRCEECAGTGADLRYLLACGNCAGRGWVRRSLAEVVTWGALVAVAVAIVVQFLRL